MLGTCADCGLELNLLDNADLRTLLSHDCQG